MSVGSGHSSNVRLRLIVNNTVLSVSQVGHKSLILRPTDFECPAESEADIVVQVDDHVSTYRVILDDGIVKGDTEIRYSDVEPLPPPIDGTFSGDPVPF